MDYKKLETTYYFNIKSIAEAFDDITWTEKHWGGIFEWPNFYGNEANFAVYNLLELDNKSLNASISWVTKDATRKLFTLSKSDIKPTGLKSAKEITIMFRKPKKIPYPLLMDNSINKYSYKSRDASLNLGKIVELIGDLLQIQNNQKFEFIRYTQALLHLFNGIIWTLEDEDTNVISIALTTEFDHQNNKSESQLLEFLVTKDTFRSKGYGKTLLEAIIARGKKKQFVVRTEITNREIFKKFEFEEVSKYMVWRK